MGAGRGATPVRDAVFGAAMRAGWALFLAVVYAVLAGEAAGRAVSRALGLAAGRRRGRVVVVGGGFGGSMAATALQREFDVTLVDGKGYFEFTPSVPRALVDDARRESIQIPHRQYVRAPGSRVLHARAAAVAGRRVLLEGGGSVAFDYLVLATGTDYRPPFKEGAVLLAHRLDTLHAAARRVRDARRLLVVGGGATGVEVAAEVACRYPGKDVSLVTSGPRLLARFPAEASRHALEFLEARGVRVRFGERLEPEGLEAGGGQGRRVRLPGSGEELAIDEVLLCTGVSPNSEVLRDSGGAPGAAVGPRGYAEVNGSLQLRGVEDGRVFVAGDLAAPPHERLAQAAERRGSSVARSVRRLAAGLEPEEYRPPRRLPVAVSLGPSDGLLLFGRHVFRGLVPAAVKEIVEWRSLARYRYGVENAYLLPGVAAAFDAAVHSRAFL